MRKRKAPKLLVGLSLFFGGWEAMIAAAWFEAAKGFIEKLDGVPIIGSLLGANWKVPLIALVICAILIARHYFSPGDQGVESESPQEPMPEMSLVQAVEYLVRREERRPGPHMADLSAWALQELRDAAVLGKLTAYGERWNAQTDTLSDTSKVPLEFLHQARFVFVPIPGDGRFDGGRLYREGDGSSYEGIRFVEGVIISLWPEVT